MEAVRDVGRGNNPMRLVIGAVAAAEARKSAPLRCNPFLHPAEPASEWNLVVKPDFFLRRAQSACANASTPRNFADDLGRSEQLSKPSCRL